MEDLYFSEEDERSVEMDEPEPVANTVLFPQPRPDGYADLSGVAICRVCDRLLEDTQAQSQLLCFHKFHTFCITHFLFQYAGNRCPTCEQNIWNRADYGMNHEIDTAIREKNRLAREKSLQTLESAVSENKELLGDLKIVKRSIREARKALIAYHKVGKQYGDGFREETKQLCEIMKTMKEQAIRKIQKSDQAKEYRSKRARAAFYIQSFDRKYPSYTLARLRDIKKLSLPSRWDLNRILYASHRRWKWRLGIRI